MKKLIQWFKRVVLRQEPEDVSSGRHGYLKWKRVKAGIELREVDLDDIYAAAFQDEPTLQQKLTKAIETENYELAAIIRDEILNEG